MQDRWIQLIFFVMCWETTKLKMTAIPLFLALAALLATSNALHNVSNCSSAFQTILEKAIEIKNHCNIRGFYDCCEVSIIVLV